MPAYGHGFGLRYDLPLPLGLWIIGAGSTVLLSFLVVAVAVRVHASRGAPSKARLIRHPTRQAVVGKRFRLVAQVLMVATLLLIVVAGIVGDQTPTRNLAPTAIWIAWWVGFSYLSAFVGNVWSVVNPWVAIFDWCAPLLATGAASSSPKSHWPAWVGAWPATALFLVFAWLELIWEGRSIPSHLAWLAIGFSIVTWTGMLLFGRDTWLRHADPFALAFGILSRFGLAAIGDQTVRGEVRGRTLGLETDGSGVVDDHLSHRAGSRLLRPPGAGLLYTEDVSPSLVVFVIVMLSTVTFDGVMATPLWQRIEGALYTAWPALGDSRLAIISTLGLLSFSAVFIMVYRLISTLIARASGNRITPGTASRTFVLTLVPIAIAYLVAHYLSYFLIQGQLLIRLASDPFGFGWDVFGTAGFRPDIGIVGARFVWYTSSIAIVIGHVVAASLAHVIALRRFDDPRVAIRSQIPMLVLMVAYTMLSLWIIAQPIVE